MLHLDMTVIDNNFSINLFWLVFQTSYILKNTFQNDVYVFLTKHSWAFTYQTITVIEICYTLIDISWSEYFMFEMIGTSAYM